MGLHNTAIGKDFSQIFETNAIAPIIPELNKTIQPIVDVKPYTQFLLTGSSTSTLLNASTNIYKNREVYITGVHMTAGTTITGSIQLAFVLADKSNPSIYLVVDAGNNPSSSWNFGERGLLLDKNNAQAINIVVNGIDTQAAVEVWGYIGSDRGN